METSTHEIQPRYTPWNKGKLIGQKHPLKLKDIWAIRIRLQVANNGVLAVGLHNPLKKTSF